MRYLIVLTVVMLLTGCAKSNGQICVDNYMEMFDKAQPNASSDRRATVKRLYTIQCTDPNMR